MAQVVGWVLGIAAVLAVPAFLWASARSSRKYEEFFQPPDDLKRADDSSDPTGGSPSGGSIWPGA